MLLPFQFNGKRNTSVMTICFSRKFVLDIFIYLNFIVLFKVTEENFFFQISICIQKWVAPLCIDFINKGIRLLIFLL